MPKFAVSLIVMALVASMSVPLAAQVIQPPPRSTGGLFGGPPAPDPNRTAQRLEMTLNLLGGYNDTLGGAPSGPLLVGYSGTAETTLRFWRGRSSRSFETSGRAYVNSYPGLGLDRLIGGNLNLRATTSMGRATNVVVAVGALYEPTALFGAFGTLNSQVGGGTPDSTATQGVIEDRWLGGSAQLGFGRTWSPRQQSNLAFSFSERRSTNDSGLGSRDGLASFAHSWNFRRSVGLMAVYRHADQRTLIEPGADQPYQSDGAEIGVTIAKRFSPTRRLEINGGGGATRAQSLAIAGADSVTFTSPSAFASVRLDLMRTWALSADYRHDVTMLQGLTPQPFVADAATVSTGGRIAGPVAVIMSAAFSNGNAPQDGSSLPGDSYSYEALSGTGQIQYSLARWVSLLANYSYYRHVMQDVTTIPEGFPARYSRSSVRVGVTMWLPLYGAF